MEFSIIYAVPHADFLAQPLNEIASAYHQLNLDYFSFVEHVIKDHPLAFVDPDVREVRGHKNKLPFELEVIVEHPVRRIGEITAQLTASRYRSYLVNVRGDEFPEFDVINLFSEKACAHATMEIIRFYAGHHWKCHVQSKIMGRLRGDLLDSKRYPGGAFLLSSAYLATEAKRHLGYPLIQPVVNPSRHQEAQV